MTASDRCPNCGEPERNGWCYSCQPIGRPIVPDRDVVDLSMIAERAGTTRGTVASWKNRHVDFPAPLRTLAIGPVWLWSDVAAWLRQRAAAKPASGRPNCVGCGHPAIFHGRALPRCDSVGCDCAGYYFRPRKETNR